MNHDQLVDAKGAHFPAVLTYKKACDWLVITMFRGHTLGNSSCALHNGILEIHSEEWLKIYLSDCKAHRLLYKYAYMFKLYNSYMFREVCVRLNQPILYRVPGTVTISILPQCLVCHGELYLYNIHSFL